MARRLGAPGGRRRVRTSSRPVAPVPFLLAAPRRPEALATPGAGEADRRRRLDALWDELRPLEESAWRGALKPRGLARLQRLRVAFAALFSREAG